MACRPVNIENKQYFRGVKCFLPKADKFIGIVFLKVYIVDLHIIKSNFL
jgi:hypothetical protein